MEDISSVRLSFQLCEEYHDFTSTLCRNSNFAKHRIGFICHEPGKTLAWNPVERILFGLISHGRTRMARHLQLWRSFGLRPGIFKDFSRVSACEKDSEEDEDIENTIGVYVSRTWWSGVYILFLILVIRGCEFLFENMPTRHWAESSSCCCCPTKFLKTGH